MTYGLQLDRSNNIGTAKAERNNQQAHKFRDERKEAT